MLWKDILEELRAEVGKDPGGIRMHQLFESLMIEMLANPTLEELGEGAGDLGKEVIGAFPLTPNISKAYCAGMLEGLSRMMRLNSGRAENEVVIVRVRVDRSRSLEQACQATGRALRLDEHAIVSLSSGEGDEVDVHFFRVGHPLTDEDLEKEYELRGLRPADPYSLAAVHESDPEFADDNPNGTHWKDDQGKWCHTTFDQWENERVVVIDYYCEWEGRWWFAGIPK